MDLDTQGRLLLRVSMEGEKDDIQFYFGRAFRALKRAENDMTRRIVETVLSGSIVTDISDDYIFSTLSIYLSHSSSPLNEFNSKDFKLDKSDEIFYARGARKTTAYR